MNFAFDLLHAQSPARLALVELTRDGTRREWSFGEVEQRCAEMAGALARRGVGRGDVVMTLIGNRPQWVFTMMACFRIGAVALPCTEQLRAKDLRLRLSVARPSLIVADERNREQIEAATPDCPVMWVGDGDAAEVRAADDASQTEGPPRAQGAGPFEESPNPAPSGHFDAPHTEGPPRARGACRFQSAPPHAAMDAADPALITFTSGTAGEAKAVVHGQRYLYGQRVQAEHWLGAKPGELVWCTAASGWSKSARNVFMAPWLMGAPALLHDARFDPHERLDILEEERVSVLCMAPTEYRVIAKRARLRRLPSLKGMVAAGEALNPEVLAIWREATGLDIRDGYGQTETGQMTGMGMDGRARPGSMGRALPDVGLSVIHGELVADPQSVPTFFLGYLGEDVHRTPDGTWEVRDRRRGGPWHTGDRVREGEDGYLYFEGRADDVIISAGYRIGPFEVESALIAHPAVAEAAAVAAPDEERGAVVRAVVVLREGHEPSERLARELQEHVKRETAPYKYPRIVEFARELPKTASGKVKRAQLRDTGS
ncbi:MAG TPA: AMP-binding protein [Solirubrobacteraceae bacterium]|nr:AMP-binding protein [Solirubrobacteraceae bacterium]